MNPKEALLEQFSTSFDKKNWFAPITSAVSGLTEAKALSVHSNAGHSIAGIVNHLAFWNERYLIRFLGLPIAKMENSNDSTFESGQESWETTREKLIQVLLKLRNAIEACDSAKLGEPAFEGSDGTWLNVIQHINTHNAYHTGEIVILRKLQGSWKPELGV